MIGCEDVSGLGHEVNAAENDIFRAGFFDAVGCLLGEFEAVAGEVGEGDDLILLVMVAEDDEVAGEFGFARGDGGGEVLIVAAAVGVR